MQFDIFKVLDISTKHMPSCTIADLYNAGLTVYVHPEGYGHIVVIPCCLFDDGQGDEDEANELREKLAKEVIDIFQYAIDCGCRYVNFDKDGCEYPDLPAFKW